MSKTSSCKWSTWKFKVTHNCYQIKYFSETMAWKVAVCVCVCVCLSPSLSYVWILPIIKVKTQCKEKYRSVLVLWKHARAHTFRKTIEMNVTFITTDWFIIPMPGPCYLLLRVEEIPILIYTVNVFTDLNHPHISFTHFTNERMGE